MMTSQRLTLAVAALAVALYAAYYLTAPTPPASSPRQLFEPSMKVPVSMPEPERDVAPIDLSQIDQATEQMGNPLERSEDLRATYEQFKNSHNAIERHTAYRAWSACFPTLIAPQGQSISIDILTRSLPANAPNAAARVEAYRGLQARCRNFSDMTREQTLSATRQQQEASYNDAILSPGEIAAKHLREGDKDQALHVAHAIVASRDPFAISSLREFINQYVVLQVDAQMVTSTERPDLRSLAFSLAACQMGLECGPASLTALQMCASMGECAGGVADRYLQALPSQADRDALQTETRRVLDAIQSGNFKALGL